MEQDESLKGVAEEETSQAVSEEETIVSEEQPKYTESFLRDFQSKADKRTGELEHRASLAERDLEDTKSQYDSLVKRRDELEGEVTRIEHEALEGYPDKQSAAEMRREATKAKARLRETEEAFERNKVKFEKEKQDYYMAVREKDIASIATRHGIKPGLLKYVETFEEAEAFAKEFAGEQGKSHGKDPSGKLPFKVDSGISDAGGLSDEAFLQSYGEGKSDDHARATKLLNKLK